MRILPKKSFYRTEEKMTKLQKKKQQIYKRERRADDVPPKTVL